MKVEFTRDDLKHLRELRRRMEEDGWARNWGSGSGSGPRCWMGHYLLAATGACRATRDQAAVEHGARLLGFTGSAAAIAYNDNSPDPTRLFMRIDERLGLIEEALAPPPVVMDPPALLTQYELREDFVDRFAAALQNDRLHRELKQPVVASVHEATLVA
jgi:hypothetical protein